MVDSKIITFFIVSNIHRSINKYNKLYTINLDFSSINQF